jgi:hypothetical protein
MSAGRPFAPAVGGVAVERLIDMAFLAVALLVLGACEIVGRRIWLDRLRPPPSRDARWMAMLVILTLAGGFIGSFSWWLGVPGSFAWQLPPLAGRMLGSAGWSFAFVAFLALQRPTFLRMRLVMLMLFVYLAPLALALVALHLDRLDFLAPITYPFLAVVALLSLGAAWFLWRRTRVLPIASEPPHEPPTRGLRSWLWIVALVTGAWSVALAVTDAGPIREIWTWPGDPLSSRLIASMLVTVAICSMWTTRNADAARIMTGVAAIYGIGLLVASLQTAMGPGPTYARWPSVAYVVVFAAIGLGSVLLLWREGMPPWRRLGNQGPSHVGGYPSPVRPTGDAT